MKKSPLEQLATQMILSAQENKIPPNTHPGDYPPCKSHNTIVFLLVFTLVLVNACEFLYVDFAYVFNLTVHHIVLEFDVQSATIHDRCRHRYEPFILRKPNHSEQKLRQNFG